VEDVDRSFAARLRTHGTFYGEVAEVCQVAVGTVKSRVNRARCKLAALLDHINETDLGPDDVIKAALAGE
jgi:RNA polymerase sigma-70 factor (ECF subfamily)